MRHKESKLFTVNITPDILKKIYQGNFSDVPQTKSILEIAMSNYIQESKHDSFLEYLISLKIVSVRLDTNKTPEYADTISFFENRIKERKKELENITYILEHHEYLPNDLHMKFIKNTITEKERQKIIDNINARVINSEYKKFKESLIEYVNFKVITPLKDVDNEIKIFKLQTQLKDENLSKEVNITEKKTKPIPQTSLKVWIKKRFEQLKNVFKSTKVTEKLKQEEQVAKIEKKTISNVTHKLNPEAQKIINGSVNPSLVVKEAKKQSKEKGVEITSENKSKPHINVRMEKSFKRILNNEEKDTKSVKQSKVNTPS